MNEERLLKKVEVLEEAVILAERLYLNHNLIENVNEGIRLQGRISGLSAALAIMTDPEEEKDE